MKIARNTSGCRGFTLIELLVALTVSSIILTAVCTLAYALGSVNETSSDISQKQAQVRYVTNRISELLRHCKLVCGTVGDDMAIWRADENRDGQIGPNELVYLEAGSSRNYLKLLEFPSASGANVALSAIRSGTAKQSLINSYDERRTTLVPVCSNVQFLVQPASPWSKFAAVSFDLAEDGTARRYQISGALRGWAGNLLSADGSSIVSDDD